MKKLLCYILCITTLVGLPLAAANAVNCIPKFNGNYTVEGSCTWPGNYKVFGDIIVGGNTVTVPTGTIVGIDLTTKKVTFTTGKMTFAGTAKMDNSVSTRYTTTHAYVHGPTNKTSCPAGYEVVNMARTAYQGATVTDVPAAGNFYCGKS